MKKNICIHTSGHIQRCRERKHPGTHRINEQATHISSLLMQTSTQQDPDKCKVRSHTLFALHDRGLWEIRSAPAWAEPCWQLAPHAARPRGLGREGAHRRWARARPRGPAKNGVTAPPVELGHPGVCHLGKRGGGRSHMADLNREVYVESTEALATSHR